MSMNDKETSKRPSFYSTLDRIDNMSPWKLGTYLFCTVLSAAFFGSSVSNMLSNGVNMGDKFDRIA